MSSLFGTSSISYRKGGKSCIKVGIRIRPRSSKEIKENDPFILCVMEPSTIIINDDEKEKKYSGYDFIFNESVTQCQLYKKMVAEYIPQLLTGYNCTIFAYGQTGTGKTFTMEGKCDDLDYNKSFRWDSDDNTGIILRAMQHIFTMLSIPTCIKKNITITYVELYNEEVYDLLGNDIYKKLKIFDNVQSSGGVYIKDVKEYTVNNMQEIHELLKHGTSMRQTAVTAMNQRSSRSHSVFTAVVVWDEIIGEDIITRKGKINLVDLAGSENIGKSGATKKSAREAGNINTSLLALGQVINALTEKSPHIPYRSSKLTRILKDSLGGSALTCLIAAVSPTKSNIGETISTLEYGLKAMNVENDIRANIKARRDQLPSNYGIINDYLQVINIYLDDSIHTAKRNKFFSIIDKDFFSKVDKLILNKDKISEETKICLSDSTHNLRKFQEQVISKTTGFEKDKFETLTIEDKAKLLENKIEEKSNMFQKLKKNKMYLQKTNDNSKNELFTKTINLDKKFFQINYLHKKQESFLCQYLENIKKSLIKCEILKEETIFKIKHKVEEITLEYKTEYDILVKQNNAKTMDIKETANNLLYEIKKDSELMSTAQISQDQCVESFKIKNNEILKITNQKIKELKMLEDFNTKLSSSSREQLDQFNTIIKDIDLLHVYIKKMKSLIIQPDKQKNSTNLRKYIEEVEKMKF
ncbi:Kinesin-like protein KIF11 [Strongyloides ratti]|uniref:Kinesin-like protein n=1 Tax=Strongyloides ratti TaxID=34506 RepID=A0A090L571_STRRB|nr:Kinesin-like protein KIF11 [Strongyloides ratti]CEF63227.1 Kinesin-like protein KIF11 [Strongyloides ratti]